MLFNYKSGVFFTSLILLLAISSLFNAAHAQSSSDSIQVKVEANGAVSSNALLPVWLYSNKYGRIKQYGHHQSYIRGKVVYYKSINKWNFELGIDAWGSGDHYNSNLGQLYAQLSRGSFTFIVGKKNLNYLYHQDYDVNFLNLRGIRPMPAISFGFFNYTPVPFTKHLLSFKASFLQGILNEDRPEGINRPYYHFSSLFVKTGGLPVHLFAGLAHSVVFGGETQDGTKIPVDWIATYTAQSSSEEKVINYNLGEAANTPGAHNGIAEYGVEFENSDFIAKFSKIKPIEDGSSLYQSQDQLLNFSVQLKKKGIVEKFSYQYAYTRNQSGPGIHLQNTDTITDYNRYLKDEFGIDTNVSTYDEFYSYLKEYANHGYKEFGRDNYFNNSFYPVGSYYDNHFFGYAFFQDQEQATHFKNMTNIESSVNIINNRIVAHHFMLKGHLNQSLSYIARVSLTRNYGTYTGYYEGSGVSDGFTLRDNYYFDEMKSERYYSLTLRQLLPKLFDIQLQIAADRGDMYDSYGAILSISKTF